MGAYQYFVNQLVTAPYNGSITHDFVALGWTLLATIAVGLGVGLILGPLLAWRSDRKRYGTTLREENATWVRMAPAIVTVLTVLASFVRLLAVRDFVVGLALIPVGGLVSLGLFGFTFVKLPDWLTASLLFVGVTVEVPLFALGIPLVLLSEIFPAIVDVGIYDIFFGIYFIVVIAIGPILAAVLVWRDFHAKGES